MKYLLGAFLFLLLIGINPAVFAQRSKSSGNGSKAVNLGSTAAAVDTIAFRSTAMKKQMKAVIIRPAAKPPAGGFPVVYLLHGFGGNFAQWITKVPALPALAEEYGCVIVCPDGGRMTLYFDNPLDSAYHFESYFLQELIPYVESNYAVSRKRDYRAVAGLSMGGFGAFFFASRRPDKFAAAVSLSGAMNVDKLAKYSNKARSGVDSTCCSIQWKQFVEKDSVALSMECGIDDYLIGANRDMHRLLVQSKVPHDYTERPGKHDWLYWENAIPYQLLFLRRYWNDRLKN